jgi:hypothetical protein
LFGHGSITNAKTEDRTFAKFAVDADVTAHQPDDVARNGESKASSARCL